MKLLKHVLLINPTITSRRSARFPLAVLNLSAALDGSYTSSIIDGNIDRDFVAMMTPHHQGAIDMAVIELRYGKNERLRRIAQEIIVEQRQEIDARAAEAFGGMRVVRALPSLST